MQCRQDLGGPEHPLRGEGRLHGGVVEHRLEGLPADQLHREPGRLGVVRGDHGGDGNVGGGERRDDPCLTEHVVPADGLLVLRDGLDHQWPLAGLDPVGQAGMAAGQPRQGADLEARAFPAEGD